MLLYAAVFSIGLAGLFQAPWWAAVVGGCLLALMFIREDAAPVAKVTQNITFEIARTSTSLLIALVSAPLAFGAGRVTAAMWGL